MKLIIAGSRNFSNYQLLKDEVMNFAITEINTKFEIISGGANGADKLGEKLAKEKNIPLKVIPANWNLNGKSAGFIRNEEMAKLATHCICFWDGQSSGTAHMIRLTEKYNLKSKIVLI